MRTHSLLIAALLAGPPLAAQRPLKVVTSIPVYAAIAREVVGDRGTVTALAHGDEEPHFVQPKPSFVPLLGGADVFVTTGLDLELWVPALLDKAANPRVSEGGRGYVAAYGNIPLLEVPASTSRSQGDIHVYGNPHIYTDPINAIQIARNIHAALVRVSPADSGLFRARTRDFERRVLVAQYGEDVVRAVTPEVLFGLAQRREDWDYLQRTVHQGAPLATRLGGWMKQGEALRGREMVCYHKEFSYFSARFGVTCVEFLEPKPGIPPSPRHVQRVVELMRERHIAVVFSPNYYDRRQLRQIAERTGATAVIVPDQTQGAPGVDTYFDLVDTWIRELGTAFGAAAANP